jgi:hypothetical protein
MQRSLSTQGVGRDRLRDDRNKVGAVPVVRVRTSCARPSPAKPRIHGDTATNSPGKPFTHSSHWRSSARAIAATMAMRAPLIQAGQAAVCSPLRPANQGEEQGTARTRLMPLMAWSSVLAMHFLMATSQGESSSCRT